MGNEQENDVLRRLFQSFQQTVCRLCIHAFRRMHQYHAQAAADSGQVNVFHNIAHGIDFDLQKFASRCLTFGNFRREFVKVGMGVLAEQMTRSTLAAWFMTGLGRFAQQCLRDKAGKLGFAGIFFAGKQPGVGTVLPMGGELLPLGFMPWINHIVWELLGRWLLYSQDV